MFIHTRPVQPVGNVHTILQKQSNCSHTFPENFVGFEFLARYVISRYDSHC